MNIITTDQPCALVTETGDYVTLTWDAHSITVPTLPRPGNYTEVIYLADDGALTFIPGTVPTMVATLACHAGAITLTLCPLTPLVTPTQPV
jgi:hypothetical protein